MVYYKNKVIVDKNKKQSFLKINKLKKKGGGKKLTPSDTKSLFEHFRIRVKFPD